MNSTLTPSQYPFAEPQELGAGLRHQTDFVSVGRLLSRPEFVEAFPFPLLVTTDVHNRPRQPQRTEEAVKWSGKLEHAKSQPPATALTIIAVRKIQRDFRTMISVGRTQNNDVVVQDVRVSKFHAYFRQSHEGLELVDADSRNGTWVGTNRLVPHRRHFVRFGDAIQLAGIRFTLLDATACWELLRSSRR